jgi:hypothetical protein
MMSHLPLGTEEPLGKQVEQLLRFALGLMVALPFVVKKWEISLSLALSAIHSRTFPREVLPASDSANP